MRKRGKHFTWIDRLYIERLYNSGETYRSISVTMNCAVSSVYAEIQHGLYDHLDTEYRYLRRYSAQIAQDYTDAQATAKGPALKLGHRYDYANTVSDRILSGASPDAIVGQLRRDGKWTVSTSTLYRYIDRGYIPGITNCNLWLKSKRKREYRKVQKATRPPKGQSIENRPDHIRHRVTPGHWEMDTVIGKSKGKGQALLVLTERLTRYEIILHLPDKTAKSVVHAVDRLTLKYPKGTFQTITVDNGSEFQDCHRIEHDRYNNKRLTLYYCHPFSSWERGSNECANKLIRRHFPKGQSLKSVTQSQCQQVADYMNNLPRRILGYATAAELFEQFQKSLTG